MAAGSERSGGTQAPTRRPCRTLGAQGLHRAAELRGLRRGRPRRQGGNSPSQGRASTTTVPLPANAAGQGTGRGGGGGEARTTAAATAASAAEQAGWEEEAETRLPEGKSPPTPAADWTARTPWRRSALRRVRGSPSTQKAPRAPPSCWLRPLHWRFFWLCVSRVRCVHSRAVPPIQSFGATGKPAGLLTFGKRV